LIERRGFALAGHAMHAQLPAIVCCKREDRRTDWSGERRMIPAALRLVIWRYILGKTESLCKLLEMFDLKKF
jgi:hypothetical protein